ncbi:G-protein coupled receptor GRL101-like [Amphiura filiformis]|uniref:G-protein coupled receptor GRL101-like n=1 Tax=Amphiura filiformis TaxID=82378 RepID=UPI003B20D8E0
MIFPTDLKSPDKNAFSGLESLQTLSADDYRFCCFFDNLLSCETPPSPFATCEGLLRRLSLRFCIWILGLSAIIGNIFVIVWRWKDRKHSETNKVQILLIINLAISDLLMGIYMLIIGGADAFYGHRYYLYGETWREHGLCKFAGIISVLSSEASVFMVTVISIDRFLCVVFPFGNVRLRKKSTVIVITVMWSLAAIFSIIPTILSDHIEGFYGLSDVCIGLPLVTSAKNFTMSIDETNDNGFVYYANESEEGPLWYYSIFLFIVLNLICFLIVLVCYIAIFISVKRSEGRRYACTKGQNERNEQIKMAVKMALIVWTDLCCWVAIIIMGILSQSGAVEIPVEVYAWTVVFILPINSCINPYLYTISAHISAKKRNSLRRKKKVRIGEESQRLKTQSSFVSDNNINITKNIDNNKTL